MQYYLSCRPVGGLAVCIKVAGETFLQRTRVLSSAWRVRLNNAWPLLGLAAAMTVNVIWIGLLGYGFVALLF
jgi:hypothetical protein